MNENMYSFFFIFFVEIEYKANIINWLLACKSVVYCVVKAKEEAIHVNLNTQNMSKIEKWKTRKSKQHYLLLIM